MIFSVRFLFLSECLSEVFLNSVSAYISESYNGYTFTMLDSDYQPQYLAQSNCQNNGSTLAEIKNSDIQNYITQFINNHLQLQGNYMVITNGIENIDYIWRWTDGSTCNNDLTIASQTDTSNRYAYLQLSTSGTVSVDAARPSDLVGGYICQGLSTCTNADGFKSNGRCYNNFTAALSWYDARDQCLSKGGDLASFDFVSSHAEWNVLNGSMLYPSTEYWIGLRREYWTWQSSNTDVKYSNWASGHPYADSSNNCICMSSSNNWQWVECNCGYNYYFICMSESLATPVATSTTTFPTTSVSTAINLTSDQIFESTTSNTNSSAYGAGTTDLAIGIGVGVGAGIVMIAVVVVVVVVIVKKRRSCCSCCSCCSCPMTLKSSLQLQPPDVVLHQSNGVNGENPYATVLRSQMTEDHDVIDVTNGITNGCSQNKTIYASLEFIENSLQQSPPALPGGRRSTAAAVAASET